MTESETAQCITHSEDDHDQTDVFDSDCTGDESLENEKNGVD